MKTIKIMTFAALAMLVPFVGFCGKAKTLYIGDITLEPEDSLTFTLEDMVEEINGLPVMEEYLPSGIDVEWTGKKFKTPKAGKVKYSKKEEGFVTTNDDNPCGFKVSINKKTGKVSGSFKVYVEKSEKKVKSYSAKIKGYLGSENITVTIKKVGTFSATLD